MAAAVCSGEATSVNDAARARARVLVVAPADRISRQAPTLVATVGIAAAPASSTLSGCDSLRLVSTLTWMRGKYCGDIDLAGEAHGVGKPELRNRGLAFS